MESLLACPVSQTRPQLLAGPKKAGHYRRSSTVKAPRKRTFVFLEMSKRSAFSTAAISKGVEAAGAEGSAAQVPVLCMMADGGDNNNRNINGRFTGGRGGNGDNWSKFPSFSGDDGFSRLRAVLLGAFVMSASYLLIPSLASASPAPQPNSPSLPTPFLPLAAMMLSPVKGPLPSSPRPTTTAKPAPIKVATPSKTRANLATGVSVASNEMIVYGQVELSEHERRMLGRRQQFFSETLRSEAVRI